MFYIYLYPVEDNELINPKLVRGSHEYKTTVDVLEDYIPENAFAIAVEADKVPNQDDIIPDGKMWFYDSSKEWFQIERQYGMIWKNEAPII